MIPSPHTAQTIRGAVHLPAAGRFGTFSDGTQAQVARDLSVLTQGQRDTWLVFFCLGVRCWESYNAALRARAAGYPNIYWYRGGWEAWDAHDLPKAPLILQAWEVRSLTGVVAP